MRFGLMRFGLGAERHSGFTSPLGGEVAPKARERGLFQMKALSRLTALPLATLSPKGRGEDR